MDALSLLKHSKPTEYALRQRMADALDRGDTVKAPIMEAGRSKAAFDIAAGTGEFMITTPTEDRVLDVVVSEGMDNKNFRKNPVVLWGHDDSIPPVGRSIHEKVIEGSHVEAGTQFDLKNDPDGFNQKIFGMYADRTLNATSIRFLPQNFERIMKDVTDEDGNKSEQWNGGFRFLDWELVEYSMVGVPMNPDAIRLAYDTLERYLERGEGAENDDQEKALVMLNELKSVRAEIRELHDLFKAMERNPFANGMEARRALDHQVALEALSDLSKTLT